jgi:hypothetical protein
MARPTMFSSIDLYITAIAGSITSTFDIMVVSTFLTHFHTTVATDGFNTFATTFYLTIITSGYLFGYLVTELAGTHVI